MHDLFDLTSQNAVVLGGTGALGGAIAQALAEAGARVVVLGRDAERGAARVAAIEAKSGTALFFQADALGRASLEDARETILERFGSVEILVNAAGGTSLEPHLRRVRKSRLWRLTRGVKSSI